MPKTETKVPAPDLSDDPLYTTDEAARYLKTTAGWMKANRKKGPAFVRLGGKRLVRYRRSALNAYAAANSI